MKVTVIEHRDVRGKEQLFLKINNGINEVLINIGKKNFDAIHNLITEYNREINNTKSAQLTIQK